MTRIIWLCFAPAWMLSAWAQVPYLINDLTTDLPDNPGDSPGNMIEYAGKVYLTLDDGRHGGEIWAGDGTPGGTQLLVDLNPGMSGSNTRFVGVIDGFLFFAARDSGTGEALWRTDGTENGTVMIADPFPGIGREWIERWVTRGSQIFFVMGDSLWVVNADGTGLTRILDQPTHDLVVFKSLVYAVTESGTYVTDGTPEGTNRAFLARPQTFYPLGDLLLMRVSTPQTGTELHAYDGSGEPELVKDINPGNAGSNFSAAMVVGNRLFFWAYSSDLGTEPWVTDGTPDGTYLVKDVVPGNLSSNYSDLVVLDDLLYFSAPYQGQAHIWVSDGTEDGTRPVVLLGNELSAYVMTSHQGEIYFTFREDLWKTDGTQDGTTKLETVGAIRQPTSTSFGLFFSARTGDLPDNSHLWITDGSPGGTYRFIDVNPGYSDSELRKAALFGDEMIVHLVKEYDNDELWRSRGWIDNTRFFFEENHIRQVIPYDDRLLINTEEFTNGELWNSDGTAEGTARFASRPVRFREVAFWNDDLYAISDLTLYRSKVPSNSRTLNEVLRAGYMSQLTPGVDRIFFRGATSGTNIEVMASDGTPEGSGLLADLKEGGGSYPLWLTLFGDKLWLAANLDDMGRELVRVDLDGSNVLKLDLYPGIESGSPENFKVFGNLLLFTAHTPEHGRELWRTDGTEAGTQLVKDILPGSGSSQQALPEEITESLFVEMGGFIYFAAMDAAHGHELWRTDGTEAGTTLIADIFPGERSGSPAGLTVMNGRLYFSAADAAGRELWTSDGTAAGTRRISDILPGPASSSPELLGAGAGVLYFSAAHPTAGRELTGYRELPDVTITAPDALCSGSSGNTASVPHVNDAAVYAWTITNGVIDRGQETAVIQFTANGGGDVELGCTITIDGKSDSSSKTVPVLNAAPAMPGAISGVSTSCPYPEALTYSIPPQADATSYEWRIPAGSRIVSGRGTTELTVLLGELSGEIAVKAINPCGEGPEQTLAVTIYRQATPAYAGENRVVCTTSFQMEAETPSAGTGTWSILSGRGGSFADVNDPNTEFTGVSGETYELEWRISLPPCDDTYATVTLAFVEPLETADAGPDQTVCGVATQLEGNEVDWGAGIWSIVSGLGGVLDNPHDPTTEFEGRRGQTYVLRWTLRGKPCDVSSDEVTVRIVGSLQVEAGPDICIQAETPYRLQGSSSLGSGSWTIVDGPDLSPSQLSQPTQPDSLFTPSAMGDYVLSWAASYPGCPDESDRVHLSVVGPGIAPESVASFDKNLAYNSESRPGDMVELNGIAYFSAWTWRYGTELWRSDGTEAGTYLLRDIDSRPISPLGTEHGYPNELTRSGEQIFFRVGRSYHANPRLWVTDGTSGGTRPVTYNGAPISRPDNLTDLGSVLYFSAPAGGSYGKEILWRSDGTDEGTWPVGEKIGAVYNRAVNAVGALDNLLLFNTEDGLWVTDGIEEGTARLDGSLNAENGFTRHGDQLFFASGEQLWVTDGTKAGTIRLDEIAGLREPVVMASGERFLFFTAGVLLGGDSWDLGLWRTDGTPKGTVTVLNPGDTEGPHVYGAMQLYPHGDKLYFYTQGRLYVTNGISGGATGLLDTDYYGAMLPLGDFMYFGASASPENTELWRTDGTVQGTSLVKDLYPGEGYSDPKPLLTVGDQLFFSASPPVVDMELLVTDGTAEGTRLVKDINPIRYSGYPERRWIVNGSLIYLRTTDAFGEELWKADANGHSLLRDIYPGETGSSPENFYVVGSTLFFQADSPGVGRELWATDGSQAGTRLVRDIDPGPDWFLLSHFFEADGKLFFHTLAGGNELGLWTSDGTNEGTRRLLDIYSNDLPLYPDPGIPWRGAAFTNNRGALWRMDGTLAGTRQIVSNPAPGNPNGFVPSGDRLFLRGSQAYVSSSLLWVTDENGENPVAIERSEQPQNMAALNGGLFYTNETQNEGREPWFTDGTPEGTFMLADLNPGSASTEVAEAVSFNGRVVFTAITNASGEELWITDGTTAGTRLFADLIPGPGGSEPRELTVFGNQLYFTASTGVGSRVLFVSDGHCTGVVPKIARNGEDEMPSQLLTDGQKLFYQSLNPAAYRVSLNMVESGVVNIADPTLRAIVTAAVDGNNDQRIDRDEADTLTVLDITDRGITDLRGIEGLTSLETFLAADNEITDIGPLVRHGNLGFAPGHLIDLRGNELDEGDCPQIDLLTERVNDTGATLQFQPQRMFGYPGYDQWPRYNILELLGGADLDVELNCGNAIGAEAGR
ncbi:MAG: hypothetical protein QNK37_05500 [Acidobacteriota bacterium]|nr:hypothetical protein [Acidobacteriota bacterium]